MRRLGLFLFLVVCASAHIGFRALIPNGLAVERNGAKWAAVGHASSDARQNAEMNPFGAAFKASEFEWSLQLCNADSDGDGFTNGMELGDPDCVWRPGAVPSRTAGISHPGFRDSFPSVSQQPPPPQTASAAAPAPPATVGTTQAKIRPDAARFVPLATLKSAWHETVAGRVHFKWGIDASDIVFAMNVTGDVYGAIGFSDQGADGPMVVCYVVDHVTGGCRDLDGLNFDVQEPAADRVRNVSWFVERTAGGDQRATFVFRIATRAVGVEAKKHQRVIFAQSRMKGDVPAVHNGIGKDSVGQLRVDFFAHSVKAVNPLLPTAWGVSAAVICLCLASGTALEFYGVVLKPRASSLLVAFQFALFASLTAFTVFAAWNDARAEGKPACFSIALGHGAAFCFVFILLPVARHSSLLRLYGMSHERGITFHIIVGILILTLTSAHFGGLLLDARSRDGGTSDLLRWNGDGDVNKLAGFLAWLFMLATTLPALTLRRVRYGLFRISHFLYIFVLIFAALHFPTLIVMMSLGLVLYLVDFVVLRTLTHFSARPKLVAARYHGEAGVSELDVQLLRDDSGVVVKAGQFALLRIGGAVGGLPHPVSIASWDPTTRVATLFVKNTQPDGSASAASGRWSSRIAEMAQRASSPSAQLPQLYFTGPYGKLQVPLATAAHVVLVSGGVGVTPALSLLQAIAEGREGTAATTRSVTFVWTSRGDALAKLLQRRLMILAAQCEARRVTVDMRVHVTSSETKRGVYHVIADKDDEMRHMTTACEVDRHEEGNEEAAVGSSTSAAMTIRSGRPEIAAIVDQLRWQSQLSGGHISVYACGPRGLIAEARDAATSAGAFLHVESFEL